MNGETSRPHVEHAISTKKSVVYFLIAALLGHLVFAGFAFQGGHAHIQGVDLGLVVCLEGFHFRLQGLIFFVHERAVTL